MGLCAVGQAGAADQDLIPKGSFSIRNSEEHGCITRVVDKKTRTATLRLQDCDPNNVEQSWSGKKLGGDRFTLRHVKAKQCMSYSPEGAGQDTVYTLGECTAAVEFTGEKKYDSVCFKDPDKSGGKTEQFFLSGNPQQNGDLKRDNSAGCDNSRAARWIVSTIAA